MNIKILFTILISIVMFSCSSSKTIFLSNNTGSPITLVIDSERAQNLPFVDSLNGLRIEKKKVFDYGKGKWTKEDKANLEALLKFTKIKKDDSETIYDFPAKSKVSHISFNVEELWVNIK